MTLAPRLVDFSDRGEIAQIEEFVTKQRGSVFHRPCWLQAIERGTGNPAIGLLVEEGGNVTGWLPLSDVFSPFFGRALVSAGFGVSGGSLASNDAAEEALLRGAEELAARYGASTVELRGGVVRRLGWQKVTGKHANFSAPLQSDDEAQLLAIPRRARAEIRKGLAGGLTVSHGRDARHRDAHYRVYGENLRNHGTPAFPRALFDAVLDKFGDDAEITCVWDNATPVSAVLSLYHAGAVMPFWGGGTVRARALHANERMYYNLMLHARRRGCTVFDYGRSKAGSGPFAFKKNWGFEPEPLTYWTWSPPRRRARNVDPTHEGYSARIALWKRLPLPLANLVGPFISRGLG